LPPLGSKPLGPEKVVNSYPWQKHHCRLWSRERENLTLHGHPAIRSPGHPCTVFLQGLILTEETVRQQGTGRTLAEVTHCSPSNPGDLEDSREVINGLDLGRSGYFPALNLDVTFLGTTRAQNHGQSNLRIQSRVLAREVLYCLSHSTSNFFFLQYQGLNSGPTP
jgi:hypothetical protein